MGRTSDFDLVWGGEVSQTGKTEHGVVVLFLRHDDDKGDKKKQSLTMYCIPSILWDPRLTGPLSPPRHPDQGRPRRPARRHSTQPPVFAPPLHACRRPQKCASSPPGGRVQDTRVRRGAACAVSELGDDGVHLCLFFCPKVGLSLREIALLLDSEAVQVLGTGGVKTGRWMMFAMRFCARPARGEERKCSVAVFDENDIREDRVKSEP